jgi:hypothetical protein
MGNEESARVVDIDGGAYGMANSFAAAVADQARARGMTCQKLYDELAK